MEIKRITTFNHLFYEVMNIFYNWWGISKNKSLEEITDDYKSNLNILLLPRLYALLDNDNLIGIYEINRKDGVHEEEYEPYLANVFIKEEYRGNGYSKILVEDAINKVKEMGYDKLYLHTNHINLYERYGFKFIKVVNTKYGPKRIFEYKIK